VAPYWSVLLSSWRKVCKIWCLAGGTPEVLVLETVQYGKPTQLTNGGTSKRIGTLIQPLKGRQITKPKTFRQPVSLNCDNKIMSQLMFAFTGRNRFKSMESLWRSFKNSITTREVSVSVSISICKKLLNPW